MTDKHGEMPARIWAWKEDHGDVWTGEWSADKDDDHVPSDAVEMVPATVLSNCATNYQEQAALLEATLGLLTQVRDERDALRSELEWYGEQARLARLIHSEGDAGRHALAADGGKRARAILNPEMSR